MPSSVPNWREQIRGRLGPHPGDAGHVVARVAGQREEVAHLPGPHPELLAHLGRPEDASRIESHSHDAVVVVVHQLHQVLVGAHDDDAQPVGQRARGHGGDEVVGLEPVLLEDGAVPRADRSPRRATSAGTGRAGAAAAWPCTGRRGRDGTSAPSSPWRRRACGAAARPPPSAACSRCRAPRGWARPASSRGAAARGRRGRRTPTNRPDRGRRPRPVGQPGRPRRRPAGPWRASSDRMPPERSWRAAMCECLVSGARKSRLM